MRGDYPWRVMVSSTMRDLGPERQAVVAEIKQAGLKPLWAEDNPIELEKRPRGFCQEMAEICDLYLMIVGPTYGFTPEGTPADKGRSVTELELDWATAANLRKVVIFIRADAENTPDGQQRALIERIRNFERGYVMFPSFSTTGELALQVRQALTNWLEAHEGGRSAWLNDVVQRYATLRNLVTQQDMPIDETALLQLRTEAVDRQERRTWDSAEALEDGSARERQPATAAQRIGAFLSGRVDDARQQEAARVASPAIIRSTQEFLDEFQRLVVVGDPGAGKSTLLRRQAHDTAAHILRSPHTRMSTRPGYNRGATIDPHCWRRQILV